LSIRVDLGDTAAPPGTSAPAPSPTAATGTRIDAGTAGAPNARPVASPAPESSDPE